MSGGFDFGFDKKTGRTSGEDTFHDSIRPSTQSPPPPFTEDGQRHARITDAGLFHSQPSQPNAAYLGWGQPANEAHLHHSRVTNRPEKRSYGQESDFTFDGSTDSDYNLYEISSHTELNPTQQPGIPLARQHSYPESSTWHHRAPLDRSRTYVALPEMSQVYRQDDFHQNIRPRTPPIHNFNDPEDQGFYDNNKFIHPPSAKLAGSSPYARFSTNSIATGIIDFEDIPSGDPDVNAIDDDFTPSGYPLNQTPSQASRPGTSTRRHVDHRWRHGHGQPNEDLQRRLGARHLQMIALGGTLGVGLFLASGKALSVAGPLGSLLGYSCMGFVVLCVMLSLGEMTALIPIAGGITAYAGRFVDDALGFAAGWMYWMSFALALPTEVTAASILIRYYAPLSDEKYLALWITLFLGVVLVTNCFNVRVYGEMEYCFGLLKVVTVLALIITMIIINSGATPSHKVISFDYWEPPNGPFRQYLVPGTKDDWHTQFFEYPNITGGLANFLAVWASFTIAAFSFLGTEIVAVAAGEARESRYALPSAVRRLFWRIAIFYVLGIFVVGLNVQSTNPRLLQYHDSTTRLPDSGFANTTKHNPDASLGAHSPWVIAIRQAMIPILPGIANGIFVFCAWSAGNSHLYASSRTLYGLAVEGKAPRVFRRCTSSGVPIVAVLTSAMVALLAYIQCAGPLGENVFDYFLRTTTVAGLIVWATFCLAYIRFYAALKQARHLDRNSDSYPYRSPFQPVLAWIGLIMTVLVVIFNGFDYFLTGRRDPRTGQAIPESKDFWPDFLTSYLSLIIFVVLFLFWKVYKKTKIQPINRLNLDTGMAYGPDTRPRPDSSKSRTVFRYAIRAVG